ncbi:MAG: hypothetical protein CVV23_11570 [Ignavibacteriae bacterium HGW-Ignavibacteriae-2]|jgi:opacity protein-like surface antigen|nr:MAG: hypothetical protein CVV23_11570 [Ignavibacteriae bacterium HGW-Ignavibacteriae-2]
MLIKEINKNYITLLVILVSGVIFGQHRGDNLSFQGLSVSNDVGVKATAMGGAVTAYSGDVLSLFNNPAGLIGINKIQVSVAGNLFTQNWRENQTYKPNRFFLTLPFYLEGLYIPDPADNGLWDYERMWGDGYTIDSTYHVDEPKLGVDQFSEEAADWKKEKNNFVLNNFSFAVPLNIGSHNFVVSAGYSKSINIEDYDRNDTYLDPHPGYTEYGDISKVNGVDTLLINWSRFTRERSGVINNITAAIAYDLSEYLNIGLGFNYRWGNSDDSQSLVKIGQFNLFRENRFRFTYLDGSTATTGTSDYDYSNIFVGIQTHFKNFSVGIKMDLPYTINRDWNYTTTIKDSVSLSTQSTSGTDEYEIPATFSVGVKYAPIDNFNLAIDYDYQPFSEAKAKLSSPDETFHKWTDKNVIKVGMEYKPSDFLTLLGGYRSIPSTFIPDGAAIKDEGPVANSYTFGCSLSFFFGRFDIAYEIRNLRYYDSYFSNTNYVTETYNNLLFGYQIGF